MAPIIPLVTVFNLSLGSTKVMVVIGVGVLIGTESYIERVIGGSLPEGFETVDLTYKG